MKQVFLLLFIFVGLLADEYHDTGHTGTAIELRQRVGQKQVVPLPYQFMSVWTIDIPNAISQSSSIPARSICQVEEPQIDLREIDYYSFPEWIDFKDVIVKYEDLQRRQEVLDMIVVQDTVAVCLASGIVRLLQVVYTNDYQQLQLLYEIPIEGVSADNPLTEGYFVSLSEAILFVNGDFAFVIESSNLTKLAGYRPTENFESVEYIEEYDIITVAQGIEGVRVYSFDYQTKTLIELGVLDSSFFNTTKVDIQDVGTYKNYLYVLDSLSGIHRVSVIKENLTVSLSTNIFNRTGCENMVIDNDTIYVTCPEVNEIKLETYKTRTYPDELFHVRNMIVADGIVVVTGDNLIKLYIDGKVVGFYEEFRIDRIRISHNRFYIATENGVDYLDWTVSSSKITCGLKSKDNDEIQGSMSTTINVVAECSKPYFDKYNLPYVAQYEDALCLYHFPLKIQFWQGREMNLKPFKIIGIVLLVLLLAIALGWFVIRRQFSKVNAAILRYSSLKPTDGGEKVPYDHMNEQKQQAIQMEQHKQNDRKDNYGKQQSTQGLSNKQKQSQHEIGD